MECYKTSLEVKRDNQKEAVINEKNHESRVLVGGKMDSDMKVSKELERNCLSSFGIAFAENADPAFFSFFSSRRYHLNPCELVYHNDCGALVVEHLSKHFLASI